MNIKIKLFLLSFFFSVDFEQKKVVEVYVMGYRLEEDNRIVINNVADLSLKKLDMLQNTELIDTVVIESELGRDEYDVEKYKEIYQSLIELTDGIDRNWSNLKKFILIYRRVSKLIEYDFKKCMFNERYQCHKGKG